MEIYNFPVLKMKHETRSYIIDLFSFPVRVSMGCVFNMPIIISHWQKKLTLLQWNCLCVDWRGLGWELYICLSWWFYCAPQDLIKVITSTKQLVKCYQFIRSFRSEQKEYVEMSYKRKTHAYMWLIGMNAEGNKQTKKVILIVCSMELCQWILYWKQTIYSEWIHRQQCVPKPFCVSVNICIVFIIVSYQVALFKVKKQERSMTQCAVGHWLKIWI